METMTAYHGKKSIKDKYLKRVRLHRKADVLTQGVGWEKNGTTKGCAVGCTLEAYDHSRYPVELGIPVEIAHLEDAIFEGLDREEAMKWPEAFLSAIKPGTDLSLVVPRFASWLFGEDGPMAAGCANPMVKDAVAQVRGLYLRWIKTGVSPTSEEFSAASAASAESAAWSAASAASAAWSAESAASAAWSAESAAWSAAWSAESAAWSAESAASAAWSAESAAWSAASAAWSAAWSAASAAWSAESAASAAWSAAWSAASAAWSAESAAWLKMRDKLIELLKAA